VVYHLNHNRNFKHITTKSILEQLESLVVGLNKFFIYLSLWQFCPLEHRSLRRCIVLVLLTVP
jgi:hypothetical protein